MGTMVNLSQAYVTVLDNKRRASHVMHLNRAFQLDGIFAAALVWEYGPPKSGYIGLTTPEWWELSAWIWLRKF